MTLWSQRCSVDDDDYPSLEKRNDEIEADANKADALAVSTTVEVTEATEPSEDPRPDETMENRVDEVVASEFDKRISCRWTTAAGARIGCVRDYPPDLRSKALEQANLSPRVTPSPSGSRVPIPSPRPSPRVRLSPRLQYMGIPTPTVALTLPKHVRRWCDDGSTNHEIETGRDLPAETDLWHTKLRWALEVLQKPDTILFFFYPRFCLLTLAKDLIDRRTNFSRWFRFFFFFFSIYSLEICSIVHNIYFFFFDWDTVRSQSDYYYFFPKRNVIYTILFYWTMGDSFFLFLELTEWIDLCGLQIDNNIS